MSDLKLFQFDDELPADVRALPRHARRVWKASWNTALNTIVDAESAANSAWGQVLNKYEQTPDGWRQRDSDIDVTNPVTFIPLTKVDMVKREVWGWAAEEAPDKAREIMDYAMSKANWINWSQSIAKLSGGRSLGNVRRMHRPEAVGKVIHFEPHDDIKKFYVGVRVTDDKAWQDVQDGVLNGFSVGGDYGKRWQDPNNPGYTRYEAKPAELSLVDSPCMHGATFEAVKADGATEMMKFASDVDMAKGFNRPPTRRPQQAKQPVKSAGASSSTSKRTASTTGSVKRSTGNMSAKAPARRSPGLAAPRVSAKRPGVAKPRFTQRYGGFRKDDATGDISDYMEIAMSMLKGDVEGHAFRGNQWTTGVSDSDASDGKKDEHYHEVMHAVSDDGMRSVTVSQPKGSKVDPDNKLSINGKTVSRPWRSASTILDASGKRKSGSSKWHETKDEAVAHGESMLGRKNSKAAKAASMSDNIDELAEQLIKAEGGGGSAIRLLQTMRNTAEMAGNFEAAENLTQAIQLAMAAGDALAQADAAEAMEGEEFDGESMGDDTGEAPTEGEATDAPADNSDVNSGEGKPDADAASGEAPAAAGVANGSGQPPAKDEAAQPTPASADEAAKKKAALYRGVNAGSLRKSQPTTAEVHDVIHALANMAAERGDDMAVRVAALYEGGDIKSITKVLGIDGMAKRADVDEVVSGLAKADVVNKLEKQVLALVKDLATVVKYIEGHDEVIERLQKATIHGPALMEVPDGKTAPLGTTFEQQIREAQTNGTMVGTPRS